MGMIEFKNVTKVYNTGLFKENVFALKNLSLTVEKGEVFGFIGPNGAGKSTAIKLLAGIIFPTSGQIFIDGVSTFDFRARIKLGFLPESPHFYEFLSAFEFMQHIVSLTPYFRNMKRLEAKIHECLDLVGLKHAKFIKIRNFSLGMVQRLGIAQAIVGDPELLIFDEPLSSLDPFGRRDVMAIIKELKEQGRTIFLSSHIIHDVEKMASRIAIVKDGSIIAEGALAEITENNSLEEFFVHEAN